MNRLLFSILFLCSFTLISSAQNEEILLTIDDTKVSLTEFERIYKKNNNNLYNENDKKSPEEYLELFIDFKLKVIEAKALKMDTNQVFINELKGYRKDLAVPYLTDVKFNEQMVKELYERMKLEVNASHILLRLAKDAAENEEQKVYNQALKIKKEIEAGKDFGEAAAEYSEDPSAKSNQGNLNYFSAFQMVAPFENAAFTTPVDSVSDPVRSAFGYHLIKVHGIRKNRGEIKVAHIMKMFPQNVTSEGKQRLKKEIDSIYEQLQKGADFKELVKQYSDDKRSAANGGEMPWFSGGRMIKEFSEPAFALAEIGDYTIPVETRFGYHIIKKTDQRGIAPFSELKAEIENKIKNDPERSERSKIAFTSKLKKEYKYTVTKESLNRLKNTKLGEMPLDSETELFILDGKTFRFSDFQNFLENHKIKTGSYFANFDNWVEYEITVHEDSKLEEKYPEFRFLMQEYYEGILLFNISEEKIWNYASKDSAGLEAFYNKSKKKHLWGERFKGSIITCKNKDIREEAEKYLSAGMQKEEILDILNAEENRITIEEGAWEKNTNQVIDYFVWGGSEPENFDMELTFIRGDKVGPEHKKLDEARGLYISDYQNYLEKEWLKKLRKKYKISINKKLLKTIESV